MSSQVTKPLSRLILQELQHVPDEAAMQQLGVSLAQALVACLAQSLTSRAQKQLASSRVDSPAAIIVTLSGELGAGKSVLVRALIHALGYSGRVKSPTYTLIESYEGQADDNRLIRIAHLDLYRLADPDELSYLGFDDVLHQHDLVLIEWPEQGGDLLPEADLHVVMCYEPGGGRTVQFTLSSSSEFV